MRLRTSPVVVIKQLVVECHSELSGGVLAERPLSNDISDWGTEVHLPRRRSLGRVPNRGVGCVGECGANSLTLFAMQSAKCYHLNVSMSDTVK